MAANPVIGSILTWLLCQALSGTDKTRHNLL